MNRRAFVQATLLAAATACVQRESDAARPDLLDVLGPAAVRDIGQRYMDMTSERDPDVLRTLIDGQRVRVDFVGGNVIVVNGWVLSRTEARQCALYAATVDGHAH